MNKYVLLIIAALLVPLAASAQIPNLTSGAQIKFQDGNNTFLKRLDSLVAFVNAGSGTVTSVAVSGGSTGLTTSGGPITTSGTITLGGTLGAGFGGTGLASYAVGDLLYASGATTIAKLAGVATGNALISGGVTTAPSWGKIGLTTHVSGTLPVANGGTNLTAVGGNGTILGSDGSANQYLSPTITTTAAAIAFTRNGSNLELNLPNADASNRGTVSTGSQTFAGAKTFSGFVTGQAGITSTASASAAALFATGVQGGSWTTETSTTTLDETDNFVEIGTLSAGITYTLPACNATRNGWEYEFLKTGTDTFGATIDPTGAETFVDTASTKTIYSQGNGAKCKCKWNGSTGTWFYSTQM
jgi:hypothetical protein